MLERLADRNLAIVIGFVVVNDATGKRDLSTLTVDDVIRCGDFLIHGGRIGDKLESRAWFIDVTDGVVSQERRRGMTELIRVEGGTDGESENLPGVNILNDDSSIVGMRSLHRMIQRALGDVLNVFVDGKDEVFTSDPVP